MPSVTFDGQGLSVKGRRVWLAAAEFHYLRTPSERWGDCLRSILDAGFNTVVLPCAWGVHEARPGRPDFTDGRGLKALVERCAAEGLWVVLKLGPSVGAPYAGGGLPAWLGDLPGIRLREPNPAFQERTTAWYRAVADQVSGLLATDVAGAALRRQRPGAETGPIVAVQLEQEWHCGQESVAETYLGELVRFAREVGFAVPVLTANDAFATIDAAADAIDVGDEPLALMRQLGSIRPGFPRFARVRAERPQAAEHMALVLAGGGQFLVEGLDFDADGRLVSLDPMVRRVARFASGFGHVLAQCDPSRIPVVADPARRSGGAAVLPLSGQGGGAVFVVAPRRDVPAIGLLGPDGRAHDALIGERGLAWFLFDVDVAGRRRLDHASATPIGPVGGSILLFAGPAGARAEISIDGSALALPVPAASAGAKPTVGRVGDTVIVLCNDLQADGATFLADALVIGARPAGQGRFELLPGFRAACRVERDGAVKALSKAELASTAAAPATSVAEWTSVVAAEYVDGTSQRYATLDGPASLAACGARDGFGWYRATLRRTSAGKALLHAPQCADVATVWVDGARVGTFGPGGDATFPVELRLGAGERSVVLLVRDDGAPARGNRAGRRAGLFGPLVEVAAAKGAPTVERNVSVNPFALGVVQDLHPGDARPGIAIRWKVAKRSSDRFILDLGGGPGPGFPGGTITIDGVPAARWNADGPEGLAMLFAVPAPPAPKGKGSSKGKAAEPPPPAKAGPTEIRLVLDVDLDDAALAALCRRLRLFEVLGGLGHASGGARYAFARWTPPVGVPLSLPRGVAKPAKPAKGAPTWHLGSFDVAAARLAGGSPLTLRSDAAPGAAVLVNGRRAGPALSVSLLRPGTNDVAVFDPGGGAPPSVSVG